MSLAHADVLGSLRLHPLGVVMAGGLAAAIGGAAMGLLRGSDPVWDFLERRGSWVFGLFFGALIVIWVVRAFVVPSWSPDPITPGGDWTTIVSVGQIAAATLLMTVSVLVLNFWSALRAEPR